MDANDRRARLFALVAEHLGKRSGCEPYLLDAAWAWLVSSCQSEEGARTYAQRLAAWCRGSQRRSLSAQVGTAAVHLLDHLRGLEGRSLSQRTVAGHRDVLRSWFGFLEGRKLVKETPISREIRRGFRVDQKAVVKADGTRQALTPDEAAKAVVWCFRIATPAEGFGVLLQEVSGLRSAEVAGAKMRGYVDKDDIQKLTLKGKGNKQRTIILEPVVVAAARRYFAASRRRRAEVGERGPLLLSPQGGHYSERTVQGWAKSLARSLGRPEISSHDLRKTAATLLMEAGAHLHEVQEHLGHSNPSLTARCYVVRRPSMTATTGLKAPEDV